jgi:hypothetical protein
MRRLSRDVGSPSACLLRQGLSPSTASACDVHASNDRNNAAVPTYALRTGADRPPFSAFIIRISTYISTLDPHTPALVAPPSSATKDSATGTGEGFACRWLMFL